MEKRKRQKKLTLNKETLRLLEREDELRTVAGGTNPTAWTQCRQCMTYETSCCSQVGC